MDASDTLIAFDRDSENIREAEAYIATLGITAKHIFIHASFASIREELEKIGIDNIDFILYDLGVSSVHYDIGDRGFSTRFDGPLDMRFDRTHGKTATDLIMTLEDRELVRIFSLYGEEKKAWFIVNAIVKERKENTIEVKDIIMDNIDIRNFWVDNTVVDDISQAADCYYRQWIGFEQFQNLKNSIWYKNIEYVKPR